MLPYVVQIVFCFCFIAFGMGAIPRFFGVELPYSVGAYRAFGVMTLALGAWVVLHPIPA